MRHSLIFLSIIFCFTFIANAQQNKDLTDLSRKINGTKAGEHIEIEGGRYNEPILINNLKGTKENPIVINAGGKVILDGTDELPADWKEVKPDTEEGKLIQPKQWENIMGKVYSLKLDAPVYALIYNDRLMSTARWPNSRWHDAWRLDRYYVLRRAASESVKGELHDGLPTENALEESSKWINYDRSVMKHRKEMLGDLGISFEGATAVMSHTWGSWGTTIKGHTAGTNTFKYDTLFEGGGSIQHEAIGFLNNRIGWTKPMSKFDRSNHSGIHFFFMGLAALDIEEEWWYHEPSKTLYFISPDGEKPEKGSVRGKRRDYQLIIKNSEYVIVKGIDFTGGAALVENCSNCVLEDCSFKFAAMHKFVTGNYDMPVTTKIINELTEDKRNKQHGNTLRNCSFEYQDGNAFEGRSTGLIIDNVLIKNTQQTTLGLDSRSMSVSSPLLIRRVTIDGVGASVGIKGGGIASLYELNNIMHFGGLQYDGASLQMGGRDTVVYRYNWSHDHPKRSYRFDIGSYPDYSNAFGEMSYNVAWNTPAGFAIKGDDHLIHNNLIIGEGGLELFNMKRWASKNERTLVANNIVPQLSAGGYDWNKAVVKKKTESPDLEIIDNYWMEETKVPAGHPVSIGKQTTFFDDGNEKANRKSPLLAILRNNYFDAPQTILRDPENLDFRLKDDSEHIDAGFTPTRKEVPWKSIAFTGSETWQNQPDVGPYESNDKHYWIPGFQFECASTPVPPDGSQTAKSDCDLMWLGAYKVKEHHFFVGLSEEELEEADKPTAIFMGTDNIYSFPENLKKGQSVYWRVDAVSDKVTVKGKVWKFRVTE